MLAARKRRRYYDAGPGLKPDRRLDMLTGAIVLLITREHETRRMLETIAERRPCTLRCSSELDADQSGADVVVTDFPVSAALGLVERTPRPVMLLAAMHDTTDLVLALEGGAADYVERGLSSRIVEARLNAVVRRGAPPKRICAQFPGLFIDVDRRHAFRDGREVKLTRIEFDVLTVLAWNAGQTISRRQLLAQVWGVDMDIDTRTVDTHVVRLRRKIETNSRKPTYIRTVHSVGYCFMQQRLPLGNTPKPVQLPA